MQKWQLFLIHFFLVVLFISIRTLPQGDPFRINETGPRTVKSQDIFLLWMEDIGGGNIKSYQKVYRYKTDGILIPVDSVNVDTMLNKTVRREDNRPGKNSIVDVASGKFNRDPYDDIVSVWRTGNSNQKIEIMISHFDTTEFFTITTATALDAGENIRQDEEIYVRTGNFDNDETDEFIIAYRDASDSVIFCMYDVDSTLQITPIRRFSNTKVGSSSNTHFVKYFIETADLNGDGIHEVVLVTWEQSTTSTTVPIMVRIYTFENGVMVPKGTVDISVPKSNATGLQDFIMAAARGQFDNDNSDEVVFSAVVKSNGTHISHHYILNVSQNLQNISVGPRQQYALSSAHNTYNYTEFGLAAGDLNNTVNKRDEVVFAAGDRIRVAAVTDNYTFETKALIGVANGGNTDYIQSNNYLKVSDINMDNRGDIVIVKNLVEASPGLDGFEIAAITFEDSTLNGGTEVVIGRLLRDENQNDVYQRYAIAVGNFDGFDFTVGTPSLHQEYGIVQPVVTLNAPPVHFDMFNGNTFDINGCYNGGNCDFWAQYKKQTTSSIEVSTEIHKDWAISAGRKKEGDISVEPMGLGVSANYKKWAIGNYGEHFSKDQTNRTTISISVEVEAREDDRIYSTVSDYDVWEYPVFHGNEQFSRRSYFALVPKNVQATWYGSKSYIAQQHIPDHEVSNILSYYPYDTLSNNPNLSKVIRASYISDRFSLDGSSSYDWNVAITDFQQSGASTQRDLGLDAGVELVTVFTFKFDNKKMTTHKVSIEDIIDLKVHLGSVNLGIGDVKYAVTPYAYWGTNDALVVDYAVQPELSPPGFPPTWWQTTYGNNSDPAFVLPWRLDPEKGFSLSDQSKRFQTKDITFSPKKPVVGDTVTISVRVRNFSLMTTSSPVSVKFYVGDPDSGGTPIIGVNGTNTVSTNGPIINRGRKDVEFRWVLPSGLPSFPRIYAVLDQENTIAEIHENNNKGFNVFETSSVSGIEDERYTIPEDYALYQSYPNPFNPTTTIKYSIPNDAVVSLKVFDILGREVVALVNEYKTAGTRTVEFNANGFASGVYFYQIRVGNYIETKKMILIQ